MSFLSVPAHRRKLYVKIINLSRIRKSHQPTSSTFLNQHWTPPPQILPHMILTLLPRLQPRPQPRPQPHPQLTRSQLTTIKYQRTQQPESAAFLNSHPLDLKDTSSKSEASVQSRASITRRSPT